MTLLTVFGDRIGGAAWLGAAAAFPTIPLAIVIAVLRYRLWNIDTIINRAIVYALLTAVLAGLTATIVGVAERAFQFAIGPGSDASVLLSTLVIVSVFDPIKRTISGIVDRRFQETEDPAIRLNAFVAEIQAFPGPLDPRRTLQRMAEVARLACHASGAEIRWSLDGLPGETLRADRPEGKRGRAPSVAGLASGRAGRSTFGSRGCRRFGQGRGTRDRGNRHDRRRDRGRRSPRPRPRPRRRPDRARRGAGATKGVRASRPHSGRARMRGAGVEI